MADDAGPLFTATVASARQLFHLLRTISFAPRVQVRITSEGMRFSAAETGVLEAFVFLSSSLFTSYRLRPSPSTSPYGPTVTPATSTETLAFSLPLPTLLSTLQILTSTSTPELSVRSTPGSYGSDPYSSSFAQHRLSRHSRPPPSSASGWGGNAFSPALIGTTGQCLIVYRNAGAQLELSVPETSGVRTSAKLSTYLSHSAEAAFSTGQGHDDDDREAASYSDVGDVRDGARGGDGGGGAGIPFDRTAVRVKAIMPSSVLADAVTDLAAIDGTTLLITALRDSGPWLSLQTDSPAGGECRVAFGDEGGGYPPGTRKRSRLLETFALFDLERTRGAAGVAVGGENVDGGDEEDGMDEMGVVRARYGLVSIRKALPAARAGTKVSLRIDRERVLSLQFMVEVGEGAASAVPGGRDEVAFVDFKIVPLWEEDEEERPTSDTDEEDDEGEGIRGLD